MTDQPIDSDDQIVDDVLPLPTDDLAVPADLTLKPWHRPRKQYVRERQWTYFAKRLIQEQLGLPSLPEHAPEVHYLTLPGIDYLDARLLGELCNDLGCRLTTTGFLAGDETNPQVARAKVREDALIKSGYLSDRSHTLPRRFEELADPQSQAYQEIKRRGSFHLVNVDACGSIAPPSAGHARRLVDAIHRVVSFQLTYHSGPWLLFLTTDAQPNTIAPDALQNLWAAVIQNVHQHDGFGDAVASVFGLSDRSELTHLPEQLLTPGEDFLKLFSLAFGKWALHLANDQRWRMKTHSTYCYSTTPQGDETATMACLAFEFIPHHPPEVDPFEVARLGNPTPRQDYELSDALRIATKVMEMDNLDIKMLDGHTKATMVDKTKLLLAEIGYPMDILQQIQQ